MSPQEHIYRAFCLSIIPDQNEPIENGGIRERRWRGGEAGRRFPPNASDDSVLPFCPSLMQCSRLSAGKMKRLEAEADPSSPRQTVTDEVTGGVPALSLSSPFSFVKRSCGKTIRLYNGKLHRDNGAANGSDYSSAGILDRVLLEI